MNDTSRRRFLEFSIAFSTVGAAACGGGGGVTDSTASALPAPTPPAPTPPAPPPPAPAPAPAPVPPPSNGTAQFTLQSAAAGTVPFTVGFALRQGAVAAGAYVATTLANSQAVVKNRWPDGSAKFAIISGRAPLAAATALAVGVLSAGTAASGTALALTDLKASGITASIGCGNYGTVSWAATDWDAPFSNWVSGPEMSSWVYRKAVGSDPHLVGWLEVRLYAGGLVEVLPWIENGYLKVAAPTSKAATYTFALGGSQRFSGSIDLPSHCRTPLISGTALSYWLGADPGVAMHHDVAYLQSTELVPTYSATVSGTDAAATGALTTSYAPLQAGGFNYQSDNMANSGFQWPIGPLPTHDVLYLTSNSGAEFGGVVRNGFGAGRYPTHYRDETTNLPIRLTSYPNLCIVDHSGYKDNGPSSTGEVTPAISGTLIAGWDPAHCPSVGFVAYLLTGWHYLMEECQFAATGHYLWNGDVRRMGSQGILYPVPGAVQTRAAAWTLRTLAQAVCASPDDDTSGVRADLTASFAANVNYYHGIYVAQSNNPFGLIQPDLDYGGYNYFRGSPWQQDFFTGAMGYAKAMGLPLSSATAAKLDAFFAWTAQSIVGRLGPSTGYWYVNADPYTMAFSPSKSADWAGGTGPWYANWAALYAQTFTASDALYAGAVPPGVSNTEGVLAGNGDPGSTPDAISMWGNLTPAIAYAVRHGVPGAAAAWARMTSASNYSLLTDRFKTVPVWGVVPASM